MLDVEPSVDRVLRKAAVLAPVSGAATHELAERFVDHPTRRSRTLRALAFRIPTRSMPSTFTTVRSSRQSRSAGSGGWTERVGLGPHGAPEGLGSRWCYGTRAVRQSQRYSVQRQRLLARLGGGLPGVAGLDRTPDDARQTRLDAVGCTAHPGAAEGFGNDLVRVGKRFRAFVFDRGRAPADRGHHAQPAWAPPLPPRRACPRVVLLPVAR